MWKNRKRKEGERPGDVPRSGNLKCRIFLVCFLFAWLIGTGMRQARAAALQRGISREVLRFHVLANSDGEADQRVKLEVRDQVLEWLEGQLTEQEENDLTLLERRVEELLPGIERKAVEVLRSAGFSYGAKACLEETAFPERTYGNCTFPAGNYRALRIFLGQGKGHNWWCILFPKLCFLDCVHAVLPEQSQEQLQRVLTEEEYESLFEPSKDEYRICFKYF